MVLKYFYHTFVLYNKNNINSFWIMSRPRLRPKKHMLPKTNKFVKYISTNNISLEFPEIVFLRAKVKITPIHKEKTYENKINKIKTGFNKYANDIIKGCNLFDKEYILTMDVSEKSVAYGKISHLKYDLFVKPSKPMSMEDDINHLSILSDKLDNKLISLFVEHSINWL